MERNDPRAGQPATGTTGSSGAPGSDRPPNTAPESGGFTDRAREIAGSAQDRLADMGSSVRERAGNAKDSLADALESGAEKLRQRGSGGQGGQFAGSTATGTVAVDDGRVGVVGDKVAGGLQSTADWIRDADIDNLKSSIERQVREHPGRTLAIAVGLGYLIGKALRNR